MIMDQAFGILKKMRNSMETTIILHLKQIAEMFVYRSCCTIIALTKPQNSKTQMIKGTLKQFRPRRSLYSGGRKISEKSAEFAFIGHANYKNLATAHVCKKDFCFLRHQKRLPQI